MELAKRILRFVALLGGMCFVSAYIHGGAVVALGVILYALWRMV